jgi:hypothetical protein
MNKSVSHHKEKILNSRALLRSISIYKSQNSSSKKPRKMSIEKLKFQKQRFDLPEDYEDALLLYGDSGSSSKKSRSKTVFYKGLKFLKKNPKKNISQEFKNLFPKFSKTEEDSKPTLDANCNSTLRPEFEYF